MSVLTEVLQQRRKRINSALTVGAFLFHQAPKSHRQTFYEAQMEQSKYRPVKLLTAFYRIWRQTMCLSHHSIDRDVPGHSCQLLIDRIDVLAGKPRNPFVSLF